MFIRFNVITGFIGGLFKYLLLKLKCTDHEPE